MHRNGTAPGKALARGRQVGLSSERAESGVREQILTAALKVYATAGTRGATTKRIAQEAGVNEVTLFRHFGSKEALLRRAVSSTSEGVVIARLPQHPADPEAELTEFCRLHHQFLFSIRSFVRTNIAEHAAHPEEAREVAKLPVKIANELHGYLLRLRAERFADEGWNARAATSLLMGALFADATQRDVMPERFPYSPQEAIKQYVMLFLRAIGVAVPARRRIRRSSRVRHA